MWPPPAIPVVTESFEDWRNGQQQLRAMNVAADGRQLATALRGSVRLVEAIMERDRLVRRVDALNETIRAMSGGEIE